jgi:hypothetical protein
MGNHVVRGGPKSTFIHHQHRKWYMEEAKGGATEFGEE